VFASRFIALGSALVLVLLSACGGSGTPPPPTAGPTPTQAAPSDLDRAYAKAMCSAFGTYLSSLSAATQRDPQLFSDQTKLLAAAAPILDQFSKDLKQAKPPKDMANFNNAVVQKVTVIAEKAKSGQIVSTAEIGEITKGAPLPPTTVRQRLVEASQGIPECVASGGMDAVFGAPITP
jgi:hypothetical protein